MHLLQRFAYNVRVRIPAENAVRSSPKPKRAHVGSTPKHGDIPRARDAVMSLRLQNNPVRRRCIAHSRWVAVSIQGRSPCSCGTPPMCDWLSASDLSVAPSETPSKLADYRNIRRHPAGLPLGSLGIRIGARIHENASHEITFPLKPVERSHRVTPGCVAAPRTAVLA
jgi:hypothetical protein